MSAMLQEVTVVAPLSPLSAQACINTVQKFGFCIMESPPCSTTTPALAARRSELHTFGEALGVVLKQSPRDEPVEDIKDFSDLDTQKDDRGCVCVCVCIYSRLVFDLVHCLKFLSVAYMTSSNFRYRSGGEMLPHSDPPTLIVLHCIHPAKRGGESQIVSVVKERSMCS